MTAIDVRYVGPTDTKPARLIAESGNGHRLIVSRHRWNDLDGEALFRKAAEALRDRMGWTGELVGGGTKRGYCFVFATPKG